MEPSKRFFQQETYGLFGLYLAAALEKSFIDWQFRLQYTKCEKGEERLSQLITYLIKDKRSQDIVKITQDEQYRKQLYQHYSIEP